MATIVNERDVLLQATSPRMLLVTSNFISVSATTNTFSTSASATIPESISVKANLAGELKGTVTWTVSPEVPITVAGNLVTVPSTSVTPGTSITLAATLVLYDQTYSASVIISSVAETVSSELSANAILVPTEADGSGGNYTNATSTMTVNIGALDNSSAWAFAWTVPAGITASGLNTRTVIVSNMTVDTASLTCVATRSGWPAQTKTLTITKSKAGSAGSEGAIGIAARIAYQVVAQNLGAPTYSPTTSGGTSFPGTGWTGAPTTATVGTIVWYSYGRFNANLFAHQGIAANTTTWSEPIAASVFQDIRSDNWSYINTSLEVVSGVPNLQSFLTVYSNSTSPVQTGYYIQKANGNFWGTNVYMQGQVIAKGQTSDVSINWTNSAGQFDQTTFTARSGLLGYAQGGVSAGESNILRVGLTGASINQSTNSAWNVGAFGIATGEGNDPAIYPGNKKGIGIVAVGDAVCIYASAQLSTTVGLVVKSFAGTNRAANLEGDVEVTRALIVGNGLNVTGNTFVTGNITATGNVVAFQSSDQRLKSNIQRIVNPLEKLRGLGGYSYDWTAEYLSKYPKEIELGLVKPHDIGVIAQQVLLQMPEAVVTRADGTLAVNYEKLIPLLIEAVLELDRRTG
jgi:hypothetical protein